MTSMAAIPFNEKERLNQLHELMVLDTPPEALFTEIVSLASRVCETPISLISLVDESRQWFKANVGLEDVKETHRSLAFCAHAILQDQMMEVPDATLDPRFADSPLVTGNPNIRFYAGVPLKLPKGESVGTICVIDHQPRTLNLYQKGVLLGLANTVVQALIYRAALLNPALGSTAKVKTS